MPGRLSIIVSENSFSLRAMRSACRCRLVALDVVEGERDIGRGVHEQRDRPVLEALRRRRAYTVSAPHTSPPTCSGKTADGAQAASHDFSPPWLRGRVGEQIVADVRAARAERRVPGPRRLPALVYGTGRCAGCAIVVAPLRHGDEPSGIRLVPADRGHAKAAVLDEHLTDPLKQLSHGPASGRWPG